MQTSSIIVVAVGQAGCQIAASFWQRAAEEHGIDPRTARLAGRRSAAEGMWEAVFRPHPADGGAGFVPRAVLVDSEPGVIHSIQQALPDLFYPENVLTRNEGSSGSFAWGYRTEDGRQLARQAVDRVAAEAEHCANLAGVLMIHALGGGTGSGTGAAIAEEMKARLPGVPLFSAAILPSATVSSTVTEPYNVMLALDCLRRSADACILFDNEALTQIAHTRWGVAEPAMEDFNHVIVQALLGITASMRYQGFLTVETSMRELLTNLVPLPDMHFLLPAFAPLTKPDANRFHPRPVAELLHTLFEDGSFLTACEPMKDTFLAMAVTQRGGMEDKTEADEILQQIHRSLRRVAFIPTGLKTGSVENPGHFYTKSLTMLANSTAAAGILERVLVKFDMLWKRRAFANWYLQAGMTVEEIEAMREGVAAVAAAYRILADGLPLHAGASAPPVEVRTPEPILGTAGPLPDLASLFDEIERASAASGRLASVESAAAARHSGSEHSEMLTPA